MRCCDNGAVVLILHMCGDAFCSDSQHYLVMVVVVALLYGVVRGYLAHAVFTGVV